MSQAPKLTPAQDAAARTRIGENLALRSGAGCGKTFVLARRFTELLMAAGDENPLRRFVALTFTDKAALEMSQRVRSMLAELAARAKGESRERILGWLEEVDDARISTIHSFCSTLLRSHAVQAGIDPNFAVCSDELTVGRMIAEAADKAVLTAVESAQEDVAEVLQHVSFDEMVDLVRQLVRDRTMWRPEDYADADRTLARWKTMVEYARAAAWARLARDDRIASLLAGAKNAITDGVKEDLLAIRSQALGLIESLLREPTPARAAALAELPDKLGRIGGMSKPAVAMRHILVELFEAARKYALYGEELGELDAPSAKALAAITSLAQRANTIFTAEKRAAGMLDFTDLLYYAHRLLEDNEDIRQSVRKQIDQLLIDECQDTDSFQAALLMMAIFPDESWQELAMSDTSRRDGGLGAPQAKLPDGRLFLVGDAKQSIYRFRGAQVEVFQNLCRRLGPRKQEWLDLSFRTHEAGAAFVNHLFGPLMGDDYEPIKARRPFAGSPQRGPSVEIIVANTAEGERPRRADESTAAQAAAVAQRIRQMLDDGEKLVWDQAANAWRAVRPRDIAILFSRMTASLDYERELARREVPYYVVAGTGFFNQQEVFDVLNALRVIDNPFDDVSFFGVLRSSLFGLDDNALMHIAAAFRPPYMPKLVATSVPALTAPQQESLRTAVELLWGLHGIKDAVGIDQLIERVLAATGYEATLLSQFEGRRMLGNVRMLIEHARAATAGPASLAGFIGEMGERVIDQSRFEQAAVAGEGEDVVRIMTIHKAKGLEFPVVVLPDLNFARRGGRPALLNRSDWGLTYKCPSSGANESAQSPESADEEAPGPDAPLSYRLAAAMEDDDQRREDIRKFYVAVTRHEDHLVLVGANSRKDGEPFKAGCYLGDLDSVLGIASAIDNDRESISYGNKRLKASVKAVTPKPPRPARGRKPIGQTILAAAKCAEDVTAGILKSAGPAPAKTGKPAAEMAGLVGPLPPTRGKVEIAVTALSEYSRCPRLYRWRYELRVPECMLPGKGDIQLFPPAAGELPGPAPGREPSPAAIEAGRSRMSPFPLDAATLGTLYHGCMEHLDLGSLARTNEAEIRNPQSAIRNYDGPAAMAASLVRRQAGEMGLSEDIDLAAVAEDFKAMLVTFAAHPLSASLAGARQVFRELDFVMDSSPAVLRGQIDLLYQDGAGAWHIVDYKSDRVGSEGADAHADRYRLQMLLYAAAAARHFGAPPADATLYFLRPAQAVRIEITPPVLEEARASVGDLAHRLIADRRAGTFIKCQTPACRLCHYARLCDQIAAPAPAQ
ncbi:MAG: UvrD-helicase domain-containing protein [Phycisphaerae bacterium]